MHSINHKKPQSMRRPRNPARANRQPLDSGGRPANAGKLMGIMRAINGNDLHAAFFPVFRYGQYFCIHQHDRGEANGPFWTMGSRFVPRAFPPSLSECVNQRQPILDLHSYAMDLDMATGLSGGRKFSAMPDANLEKATEWERRDP
jgi:hypothetical protein